MALPLRDDRPTRRVPWATIGLIVVNVVVFLFVQPPGFQSPPQRYDASPAAIARSTERAVFAYRWGAVPCEITSGAARIDAPGGCPSPAGVPLPTHKSVYVALLTSLFLHQNVAHLAGNLLFLWVFGANVEDRLGPLGHLALYLVGGVLATLGWVAAGPHSGVPAIGASGAVSVVMGAYLVLQPRGRILTLLYAGTVQLVYLPATVLLGLFFVTQFLTPGTGVAWEAHAVGMGVGFATMLVVGRLPRARRRIDAAGSDDHVAVRGGVPF